MDLVIGCMELDEGVPVVRLMLCQHSVEVSLVAILYADSLK